MAELEDLGAALARTVSTLERIRVDMLEPEDRERLTTALSEARAALAEYRRAMRTGEDFAQED
ncbi:MAG TPA: hypothetical protein VGX27_05560 [Candidatus Dormibacteraeota bacterium]|nr:hypothetical protein [Candidatus Dormibacteraeota bacterium]